jgi:nucleotide-binding universal stress UspA family protein
MTRAQQWAGFRSVLCPIDFSDDSRLALQYAAAIARRSGGRLRVLYVNDPLLVAAAAVGTRNRTIVKDSARGLQNFVDATLPPASRGPLALKVRAAVGSPADEIIKAATREPSDLIVVGTHGLTGASRLLLGSTTLSVLQHTAVPVLAVPRAGEHLVAGPGPSWPGERIVAALELERHAERNADVAGRIAEWFGSSLLLVHVVSGIVAPLWLDVDLSAHDRIRLAKAEQHLKTLSVRSQRFVPTAARVVCGNIADEIAAVTATERTELLVTALHDRRGWFGARRGSISYHVLAHATTPVLACPPNWQPR